MAANSELVFKALADAKRQRILQALVRQELNVSELVRILDQPQSTVSRHLKALREADLIRDRREGTTVTYSGIAVAQNGNGESGDIRSRLLDWIAEQPLPRAVARRLESVLQQRRARTEAFFEQVGHRWDQMRIECFGRAFQFEALTALLPREWTVADIGTGTGYLLPLLAARFRQVIAVDPVPAMLEIARTHRDLVRADNIEFRVGDLSRLPIDDGGVDLVLAVLVLHHVPSPRQALQELLRIVRPAGRLLIVEQAAHQYDGFYEQMQDRWWGFEPDSLADHVARIGFVDVGHAPLASAEPANTQAPQAPELFVLTARRTGEQPNCNTNNEAKSK